MVIDEAVLQARSQEINAEKFESIKNTYITSLIEVEANLDEMVSC